MIIVSQSRARVFNFDNITELFIGFADNNKKRSIRCNTVNNTYEELGIYETEERAKEVLKEMYNWLMSVDKLDGEHNIEEVNAYANIARYRIYEMPEK